jgi:histidine triad (HIT) family protein
MEDSIFSKIVRGEIPSHKIYEDDRVLAFLDIHPQVEGHVLVIPKVQVEFLWDLEADDYRAVTDAAKKVALHLRSALNVPYVGEKVIGLDIPHAHIQLIPFTNIDEYLRSSDMEKEPDHTRLAEIAAKIRL